MPDKVSLTYYESILLLTAFAAGAVDVISFATLGGVFASAMTGNFALLAYYVAQSDSQSAMGSVVALTGFAVGCAALLSGALIVRKVEEVVLLPFIGVAVAFATHRRSRLKAA